MVFHKNGRFLKVAQIFTGEQFRKNNVSFKKKFRDSNYPETMLNKLNMFRKTNQMIDLTIVVEVGHRKFDF